MLILCAALTLSWTTFARAQKVGTVDVSKVFAAYYKTKEAEGRINAARDAAKKDLEDRSAGYKQLADEINQLNKEMENPALSADAKDERKKRRAEKVARGRAMERESSGYRTSLQKQLQESSERVRSQIGEDIMMVVAAKVQSDGFDLVLNKSGQGSSGMPVVTYANDKMDFTDAVIAKLNEGHPAATAAATAAPTVSAGQGATPVKR